MDRPRSKFQGRWSVHRLPAIGKTVRDECCYRQMEGALTQQPGSPSRRADASDPVSTITLDYPIRVRTRQTESSPGGMAIGSLLEAGRERFAKRLDEVLQYTQRYSVIPVMPTDPLEAAWHNDMMPGLDLAFIYAMIATRRPKRYIEIGSGTSTKFARRAITDFRLETTIVSIDPAPRRDIDTLCDTVLRTPFEDLQQPLGEIAEAGDIVFFDGSHRTLQNSDATVFFTEHLASLPGGVLYGIHDILLPWDYPAAWASRFYSEQYLLMAYLLGGAGGDRVELPCHWVMRDEALVKKVDAMFVWDTDNRVEHHGGAFWLTKASSGQ